MKTILHEPRELICRELRVVVDVLLHNFSFFINQVSATIS